MPTPLSALPQNQFLNLLVISPPRMGKTRLAATCPRPIYVIASDPPAKLGSMAQANPDLGMDEIYIDACDAVSGPELEAQFEKCYREAATGAKSGIYKTIVWDTLTGFAKFLADHYIRETDAKFGSGVQPFTATISSAIYRITKIPANILVLAHDYPTGEKIPGQMDKRGHGIVPNIYGSVRGWVAGQFRDVGYLSTPQNDRWARVIKWSIEGCYGIGSNSRPGVEDSPADIIDFMKWREDKGQAPPVTRPQAKPNQTQKPKTK